MKPALLLPSLVVLATSLLAMSAHAAEPTNETGVRLLELELLPGKVPLQSVRCPRLVLAVSKTTLAHPRDAVAILDAALTRRVRKLRDRVATLPCTCARQIFLASVAAAPRRSSDFLDLAMELYPDCAAEFAGALSEFEAHPRSATATGTGEDGTPDAGIMDSPMGVSTFDPGSGGFGVGFGPGFPGAPGFTGSGSSGGVALPPAAVTAVLNG